MASNAPETSSTIDPPSSTPSTFSTSTTRSATTAAASLDPDDIPALTTPWTRPETCAYTYDVDHSPEEGEGQTAFLDWAIDEDATTFSCYPPGMFESGNSGTFSPASCPFSWYTVDKSRGSDSSQAPETTTRTCCSKDYTLHDGFCQKAMPTIVATPVTHVPDASTSSASYMTQRTTYLVNATVAHHPLVILFQEKDQDVLGLVDDDLAHSDAPAPSSRSSSSAAALPVGAKVGIALGVAGAVSALVLLAYCLLRRRRHLSEKDALSAHATACRSSTASSTASLGGLPARRQDPPPAYEPSPRQRSPRASGDTDLSADELRSLRAQQEAIRRRIEELERGDEV